SRLDFSQVMKFRFGANTPRLQRTVRHHNLPGGLPAECADQEDGDAPRRGRPDPAEGGGPIRRHHNEAALASPVVLSGGAEFCFRFFGGTQGLFFCRLHLSGGTQSVDILERVVFGWIVFAHAILLLSSSTSFMVSAHSSGLRPSMYRSGNCS